MYPVTYLRVAAGGFVLELPELVYLVMLVFPTFAIFEPSGLLLGLPVSECFGVVVFGCLALVFLTSLVHELLRLVYLLANLLSILLSLSVFVFEPL